MRKLSYPDARVYILQLLQKHPPEAQQRALAELDRQTGGNKFLSAARIAEIACDARFEPGLTTEQLMEACLRTIQDLSADEKAHFRAQLDRRLGIPPKSGEGKPA